MPTTLPQTLWRQDAWRRPLRVGASLVAHSLSVSHGALTGTAATRANGVALPFDLSLIGAQPGCMAYTDLTITSARLAGGAGNSVTEVVSVPPGIANAGFTYYTQWYSFDALGGQPFKTSNARRNVVGF